MKANKLLLLFTIFLVIFPIFNLFASAQDVTIPKWNSSFRYNQEIFLPISTDESFSHFQPIDINIEFRNSCWGKDNNQHSIRIVCWDGEEWHELESQIYNIDLQDSSHIKKCSIVFLVPDFANGKEKYYVYYDSAEKQSVQYTDHVDVEDAYFYYEPISGVSAEGDYYKIIEDGYCVYGIGQKGKAINRDFSQAVVKQMPNTKEFGLLSSDNLASFCFSYHEGTEDEDEISSDESLISKDILIDGNLMVEFVIISQSEKKNLKTTNFYKYYYSPGDKDRISVHSKHETTEEIRVKGIVNVDGRYGAILTYSSRSERIDKMRFGEILPYLHIYGEDNKIKEYKMNLNPEGNEREWIISYEDDCDIGKEAWLSYDEGETGKAHAIIFSANNEIVKQGEKELDGIQVKVAEKEYLNVIGAEIDYGAINFGRNSFEKGSIHDLIIPKNFVVEYNAEFFTTENGGYSDVINESSIYQELVKHRSDQGSVSEGDENIHTLTIIPRLTARILSSPVLANLSGISITKVYAELYKDEQLIQTQTVFKPLIGAPRIKFPKLSNGTYSVKIFRKIGTDKTFYIGFETIEIFKDEEINIFCTWPKNIEIEINKQNGDYLKGVELILFKNNSMIDKNTTNGIDKTIFNVPINILEPYYLKAYFKGFKIYDEKIPILKKNIQINLDVYDVTLLIRDKIGLKPGVNVRPYLYSKEMNITFDITPEEIDYGRYEFYDIPASNYELHISFGSFSDVFTLNVPEEGDIKKINFNALYDLEIDLFNIRGEKIDNDNKMNIYRQDRLIIDSVSTSEKLSLPPGNYLINIISNNKIIGLKHVDLSYNKKVPVLTTKEPLFPILITILVIIFIIEIAIFLIIKKISLNTFLKLLALSCLVLSLVLPWWTLNAISTNPIAEKTTSLYIIPHTMVEKIDYNNFIYLESATIPDIFTDFLGILLLVTISCIVLVGISFIPNFFLKKRFSLGLTIASIIFLILVSLAYIFGMSMITELSLGSLQGEGILDITLPTGEFVYMNGNWGLGFGFYLCIFSAITLILAGIIDFIRTKKIVDKKT